MVVIENPGPESWPRSRAVTTAEPVAASKAVGIVPETRYDNGDGLIERLEKRVATVAELALGVNLRSSFLEDNSERTDLADDQHNG